MIQIVDYKAGNPTSVKRALAAVGIESAITAAPSQIAEAERVIFPGVGHATATMEVLRQRGLDGALRTAFDRGVPILGICVGAHLVLEASDEGNTPCLGLVPGRVRRFTDLPKGLKVPHMGWNRVRIRSPHPVLEGLPEANELYFVHSYYLQPAGSASVHGTTEYGIEFVSAFSKGNLLAFQFHPEKSGPIGLEMLKRFASWAPEPAC